MRPSDKVRPDMLKPIVAKGSDAHLAQLLKHRKIAYLDAIQNSVKADVIGRRWAAYKESREAMDRLQGKKGRR